MGYENYGQVKTIVLPSPPETLSYSEYKKRYGIDLKDIFKLDENDRRIVIRDDVIKNSMILVPYCKDNSYKHPLSPITSVIISSDYVEGENDARTDINTSYIESDNSYLGLVLDILKSTEFKFENIRVSGKVL